MAGTCIDTLVMSAENTKYRSDFYILRIITVIMRTARHWLQILSADPVNTIGLHWDFGDGKGTADNKPNPNHTYQLPGTYIITLTGYGANGITVISQDSSRSKVLSVHFIQIRLQACVPATDTLHATASYVGSYHMGFWRRNSI